MHRTIPIKVMVQKAINLSMYGLTTELLMNSPIRSYKKKPNITDITIIETISVMFRKIFFIIHRQRRFHGSL